jgi:hypothetical protein
MLIIQQPRDLVRCLTSYIDPRHVYDKYPSGTQDAVMKTGFLLSSAGDYTVRAVLKVITLFTSPRTHARTRAHTHTHTWQQRESEMLQQCRKELSAVCSSNFSNSMLIHCGLIKCHSVCSTYFVFAECISVVTR